MLIRIVFLLLICCPILLLSQNGVILKGRVTYKDTGEKVKNIQVYAEGASPKLTTAVSDSEGLFQLVFPTARVGDEVKLQLELEERGYELVNHERELTVILGNKPSREVRLVVCKKGERTEKALVYYDISTKAITKNFEIKIARLRTELSVQQQDAAKNAAVIAGLKSEISDLNQQKEQLIREAKSMAHNIAQWDLAQAETVLIEALELFKAGDITAARERIAKSNPIGTLKTAKEQLDGQMDVVLFSATLAQLQLDFNAVAGIYAEADKLGYPYPPFLQAYGDFLILRNDYKKALEVNKLALQLKPNSAEQIRLKANIGIALNHLQQLDEAEVFLKEALAEMHALRDTFNDQEVYDGILILTNLMEIADKQNNDKKNFGFTRDMAEVYRKGAETVGPSFAQLGIQIPEMIDRYQQGDDALLIAFLDKVVEVVDELDFSSASFDNDPNMVRMTQFIFKFILGVSDILEIRVGGERAMAHLKNVERLLRQLIQQDQLIFEPLLGDALLHIALFLRVRDIKKSEQYASEAVSIFSKLMSGRESTYALKLAEGYSSWAQAAVNLLDYEKAESFLDSAFLLMEQYANDLGLIRDVQQQRTINVYINLYGNQGKKVETEKYLEIYLETAERMAEENRTVYLPDLAYVQKALGFYFINTGAVEKGLDYFEKAVATRRVCFDERIDFTPESIADDLKDWGYQLGNYQNAKDAIEAYDEADSLYLKMNKTHSLTYVRMNNHYGYLLVSMLDDFERGEKKYMQAKAIIEDIHKKDPLASNFELGTTYWLLADLKINQGNLVEAQAYVDQFLDVRSNDISKALPSFDADYLRALDAVGDSYYNRSYSWEAIQYFEQVIDGVEKMQEPLRKKYQLYALAFDAASLICKMAFQAQDLPRLEQYGALALSFMEQLPGLLSTQQINLKIEVYTSLAYAAMWNQQAVQAQNYLDKAFELVAQQQEKDSGDFIWSTLNVHVANGFLQLSTGRPDQIDTAIQPAIQLFENYTPNRPNAHTYAKTMLETELYRQLGSLYQYAGQFDKAFSAFKRTSSAYQKLCNYDVAGNCYLWAQMVYQTGFLYHQMVTAPNGELAIKVEAQAYLTESIKALQNQSETDTYVLDQLHIWQQFFEMLNEEILQIYRSFLRLDQTNHNPNTFDYAGKLTRQQQILQLIEDGLGSYPNLADLKAQQVNAYGNLSWFLLLNKKFSEAEVAARKALALDGSQIWIYSNLSNALVLTGQVQTAKEVLEPVKDQPVLNQGNRLLKEVIVDDYNLFRQLGITHPAMDEIQQWLIKE